MTDQSFEAAYVRKSDGELARLLRDKRDLVQEAAAALDREIQRRNLEPPRLRKLRPRSIDTPWRRTCLGRSSEEMGIERLRTKRIRGVWRVVLIVLGFLLATVLGHFEILELFWPIITTIAISVFTVWGHWELKHRLWFWATFAFVAAAHVAFFHFVGWPWGTKWVPAMTIAGFWSVDLVAVFALVYPIEKLLHEDTKIRMSRQNRQPETGARRLLESIPRAIPQIAYPGRGSSLQY